MTPFPARWRLNWHREDCKSPGFSLSCDIPHGRLNYTDKT